MLQQQKTDTKPLCKKQTTIGVAKGGPKGHGPPKCLENIVILCFERRFSKQNSVIRLKTNIFPPPKFMGRLRQCKRHFKQWRTSGLPPLGAISVYPLPASSWQHKIKETLQSDALLQLSNSKDKVFLPFLLKMYRLYCQKADKI